MKLDPKNVKIKNTWGFDVGKSDQYPLLLEFLIDEQITHATPSFLLAMIIKRMSKAYKAKTGHRLKNVYLPNIYNSENVMKQIIEAFHLVKIKCTVFKI